MEPTVYEKVRALAELDKKLNGVYANAPYRIHDKTTDEVYIGRISIQTVTDENTGKKQQIARVQIERPIRQLGSVTLEG